MDRYREFVASALIFIVIVAVAMSPVWLVTHFINQDGIAHANNAWIMLKLIEGDPLFTSLYQFNTLALPNSIGHWLLAAMLTVLSPITATKLIVTIIFAATVLSAAFLRYRTHGNDGLVTAMLISAVVSLNWLWLVGFYNFCLGVAIVVFAVALFSRWRDGISDRRMIVLSLLLLLAYFSHLIAVATLAGVIAVLSIGYLLRRDIPSMLRLAAAFIPLVPLVLVFRSVSASSDMGVSPTWRSLENASSVTNWVTQIRLADPFIFISRKTFPFTPDESGIYAIFSPIIWIVAAVLVLIIGSFLKRRTEPAESVPEIAKAFALVCILLLGFAAFGPDDFGSEHGGVLRQRLVIFAFLFFIPVYRLSSERWVERAAQLALLVALGFQTLALWEYSLHADRVGKEYTEVARSLPTEGTIAQITVVNDARRFYAQPTTMINNFSGIGRNLLVWDNYELGHYLFPVIMRRPEDKEFIYDLTRNSALRTDVPADGIAEKIVNLDSVLANDGGRIEILMVWGQNPDLDSVVGKYFAAEPISRTENIRIFRRATNTYGPGGQ